MKRSEAGGYTLYVNFTPWNAKRHVWKSFSAIIVVIE